MTYSKIAHSFAKYLAGEGVAVCRDQRAMTRFDLDVAHWKPALAVVAAHGVTDLNTFEWVPHYAMWMLLPMPSVAVTAAFCAASIVHFAEDSGPWPAVIVHATAAVIGARRGGDAAFKAMLAYLLVWHVPHHYRRHVRERRWRGLALAGLATLTTLLARHRLPDRLPLCDALQRIVLAHISCEMSLLH